MKILELKSVFDLVMCIVLRSAFCVLTQFCEKERIGEMVLNADYIDSTFMRQKVAMDILLGTH